MPVRPLASTSVRASDRFARRRERRERIVRWSLATLVVIAVGGGIYACFFSPWLSVRAIVVEGTQVLDSELLLAHIHAARDQRTWGYARDHYMIPARPERIAQSLEAEFPILESVTTDKRFPHTIAFSVRERTPVAQWCEGAACQLTDASGARWDALENTLPHDLPVVRDMRNGVRWPQSDATILYTISTIRPQLRAMRIEPLTWDLPETALPELRVSVAGESELRFSLEDDVQKQMTVLAVFLRDTPSTVSAYMYLDMRIPGRVYVKKKAQ
ncbi:MAG: FtsQ-type POTRA domain-containing protein [Candidatus Paceibacterota bacterium]|nr:MAG: FtsQ-type POTRA domain-containing protein [Candidatus Paceibacterota bacterium]